MSAKEEIWAHCDVSEVRAFSILPLLWLGYLNLNRVLLKGLLVNVIACLVRNKVVVALLFESGQFDFPTRLLYFI